MKSKEDVKHTVYMLGLNSMDNNHNSSDQNSKGLIACSCMACAQLRSMSLQEVYQHLGMDARVATLVVHVCTDLLQLIRPGFPPLQAPDQKADKPSRPDAATITAPEDLHPEPAATSTTVDLAGQISSKQQNEVCQSATACSTDQQQVEPARSKKHNSWHRRKRRKRQGNSDVASVPLPRVSFPGSSVQLFGSQDASLGPQLHAGSKLWLVLSACLTMCDSSITCELRPAKQGSNSSNPISIATSTAEEAGTEHVIRHCDGLQSIHQEQRQPSSPPWNSGSEIHGTEADSTKTENRQQVQPGQAKSASMQGRLSQESDAPLACKHASSELLECEQQGQLEYELVVCKAAGREDELLRTVHSLLNPWYPIHAQHQHPTWTLPSLARLDNALRAKAGTILSLPCHAPPRAVTSFQNMQEKYELIAGSIKQRGASGLRYVTKFEWLPFDTRRPTGQGRLLIHMTDGHGVWMSILLQDIGLFASKGKAGKVEKAKLARKEKRYGLRMAALHAAQQLQHDMQGTQNRGTCVAVFACMCSSLVEGLEVLAWNGGMRKQIEMHVAAQLIPMLQIGIGSGDLADHGLHGSALDFVALSSSALHNRHVGSQARSTLQVAAIAACLLGLGTLTMYCLYRRRKQ